MNRVRIAGVSLSAVFVACNSPPNASTPRTICTMEARAALTVEAVDSATGAPATRGARIVAQSATDTDSTKGPAASDLPVGLAYERAGTYTVTVTKPGYRQWTQSGITVTKDECHVTPVKVTARLQR
jgi:hypothetical protein